MTPNPHPASGNGVIERAIAETYVQSWDQHIGKDGAVAIMNTLKSAGLLKLSEGSDSRAIEHAEYLAKGVEDFLAFLNTKESLRRIRDQDGLSDKWSGLQSLIYEFRKRAEALKATPAPSPIDAERMREACAKWHDDQAAVCRHNAQDILDNWMGPDCSDEDKAANRKDRFENLHRASFHDNSAKAIRALPTPAREIDREKIAKIICNSHPRNDCVQDEDGRDPCTAENCRYMKTADAIISAIGGRHV